MRTSSKPWYRKERDGWFVAIGGTQVLLAKGKANRAEAKRKWHELMSDGAVSRGTGLQACIDHGLEGLSPTTRLTREQVLTAFAKHIRSNEETDAMVEAMKQAGGNKKPSLYATAGDVSIETRTLACPMLLTFEPEGIAAESS